MIGAQRFRDVEARRAHYLTERDDADYLARFYLSRARVVKRDGWHALASEYVRRARQLSRSAREFHREATERADSLLPGEVWLDAAPALTLHTTADR